VFTARYALSPYIKQIRFVFKGLNDVLVAPRSIGVYITLFPQTIKRLRGSILYGSNKISCFISIEEKLWIILFILIYKQLYLGPCKPHFMHCNFMKLQLATNGNFYLFTKIRNLWGKTSHCRSFHMSGLISELIHLKNKYRWIKLGISDILVGNL
jgi:hypothetical protein